MNWFERRAVRPYARTIDAARVNRATAIGDTFYMFPQCLGEGQNQEFAGPAGGDAHLVPFTVNGAPIVVPAARFLG